MSSVRLEGPPEEGEKPRPLGRKALKTPICEIVRMQSRTVPPAGFAATVAA